MTCVDVFDSPALPLLLRLEDQGFDLRVSGTKLLIKPVSRLTPDLRADIRSNNAALITLVRTYDEGVQMRVAEYRAQLVATPSPRVPAFLFAPGVPYHVGVCFSCGDTLPPAEKRTVECRRTDGTVINVTLTERFGRCWRCSLAWRLACRLQIPPELAQAYDESKVVA